MICKCGRQGGTITLKKAGNHIMRTVGKYDSVIAVKPYTKKKGVQVGARNRRYTKAMKESGIPKPMLPFMRRISKKQLVATDQRRRYYYIMHYTDHGLKSCELGSRSEYPLSKVKVNDPRYATEYKQLLAKFIDAEERADLDMLFNELCSLLSSMGFPKRFIENKVAHDAKVEIRILNDERQRKLDEEGIVYLAPFNTWVKLIPQSNPASPT